MNIELKQAAQDAAEAIDWLLENIRRDAPQLSGKAMGNAEKCASALRTALAQQPATATACGIPGMAKTTCPYCELSFTFEHEQPAQQAEVTDEQIAACVKRASTYGLPFVGLLNPGGTPSDFSKRFTAEILALRTERVPMTPAGRGDFTHPEPSVFLVRDVASLLGASVPDVCNALAELGYEPRRSTNAAISPDEAIAVAKRINPSPCEPSGCTLCDPLPKPAMLAAQAEH